MPEMIPYTHIYVGVWDVQMIPYTHVYVGVWDHLWHVCLVMHVHAILH